MKYHVTYHIEPHPDGLAHEQVKALGDEVGACTAVLIASLLYPEDGSSSTAFVSRDGRTGEPLSDDNIWKTWVLLASQLSESTTLSENKRVLCKDVFEIVREAILSTRKAEGA